MENVSLQVEFDSQSALHSMAQLSITELERFVFDVNALIRHKKMQDKKIQDLVLIEKINKTVLNRKKRERYWHLAEKLEADTLTDEEHAEYRHLILKEENLRNRRVKLLIQLAHLRGVTLQQVMLTLGLIKSYEDA